MSNPDYAAAYLIITRSQKAEMKLNPETLPQGALERMEQAITASPDFRIIFANEDATVFALASRWEGGQ
jgi:ABC-type sugar transport system substrate-binding protein